MRILEEESIPYAKMGPCVVDDLTTRMQALPDNAQAARASDLVHFEEFGGPTSSVAWNSVRFAESVVRARLTEGSCTDEGGASVS